VSRTSSGQDTVLKYCRHFPSKRCFHDACSYLDIRGNVRVCPIHPNPYGMFSFRKSKVVREE
jgi:hypothetical protein